MSTIIICLRNFNPRSREGSDVSVEYTPCSNRSFQSTLPRGERRRYALLERQSCHFNPRSREGSDSRCSAIFQVQAVISIHAPARGATRITVKNRIEEQFQSTLPRGERRVKRTDIILRYGNFNPRSREGSDIRWIIRCIKCIHFNPRSREGSDPSVNLDGNDP